MPVAAVPASHDDRRRPAGGPRADPLGFVAGAARRVYFAGDTDLFGGMEALGPLDAALLPVAGWGPALGPGHMDAAAAAKAAALIRPRVAVPIHWGTYRPLFARRGPWFVDPPRAFAARVAEEAAEVEVAVLDPGGVARAVSLEQSDGRATVAPRERGARAHQPTLRSGSAAGDRDRRAQRPGAVRGLHRAGAARLAGPGHLPGHCRLRPGELPGPSHATRPRGGDRVPGDRPDPVRDRPHPGPPGGRAGRQARERPPLLRARPQRGLRREPAAAGAEQGLRHHEEAGGRRREPGLQARRGRRRAGRHRRRRGRLGLRAGDHPGDEHVHRQPRRALARRRAGLPARASGREAPPGQRPHRRRGGQLRDGRAASRPSSPAWPPSSCSRSSVCPRRCRSRW